MTSTTREASPAPPSWPSRGPAYDVPEDLPTEQCLDIAATILAALSYPLRMRIVLHLLHSEATGGQLSRTLGVNQPMLTHHLRHLRVAGVLQRRRFGNHVLYRATPSIVALIHATIACAQARIDRGVPG
jgi:ArsR family transcriptional regulator, lead/cadmium/zinc/bismuth-responsive transcriptional repressor